MFEFLITLAACLAAFAYKRDALSFILLGSWNASLIFSWFLTASYLPGAAAIVDFCIVSSVFWIWHVHGGQRARLVGMLSIIKIMLHIAISLNFGAGDWFFYALAVNCLFLLQCLTAGGALYGLVNFLHRFSPRVHHVNKAYFRDEGK